MGSNAVQFHRVFRSTPEKIYRAFLDPAAMVKWLPPNGFVAEMLSMDAKVGGSYRMSFRNFSTGSQHTFGGTFLDLVPNELLRYSDRFDDPNLKGEMITTVMIREVSCGSEVTIVQSEIPEPIPTEACYLGWQESLVLLGKLVEADIKD